MAADSKRNRNRCSVEREPLAFTEAITRDLVVGSTLSVTITRYHVQIEIARIIGLLLIVYRLIVYFVVAFMPLDIANIFGDNVKRIRESKNWSQEKLSEKADLHRTYISQIESGKRNPTLLIVQQLAEALGVKPSKLLEEEGKH